MSAFTWSAVISVASPRGNEGWSSLCSAASLMSGSCEMMLVMSPCQVRVNSSCTFGLNIPMLRNRFPHMLYLVDTYEATRYHTQKENRHKRERKRGRRSNKLSNNARNQSVNHLTQDSPVPCKPRNTKLLTVSALARLFAVSC